LVLSWGCQDAPGAVDHAAGAGLEADEDVSGLQLMQDLSGLVSLLTYNVHGLPSVITMDDTPERLRQIGPLLAAYDIVGLQEDFDDSNHDMLVAKSGHPSVFRFGEILDLRFYGSGLSILSTLPGRAHQMQHYSVCHGRFESASDCLASKGLQRVRLQLDEGVEIDVYNSHLEAGDAPEDQAARAIQIDELIQAVRTHSEEHALILMGDMNIHSDQESGRALMAKLIRELDLTDACDAVGCASPHRIDRVFIRGSSELQLQVDSWQVDTGFVDANGVPLSDHDAIATHIRWIRER